LFENGKRPIDVAIELDLSASEVQEIQEEIPITSDNIIQNAVLAKLYSVLKDSRGDLFNVT